MSLARMSLHSWLEDRRNLALQGMVITRPQYFLWLFCLLVYESILIGVNLFLLYRLGNALFPGLLLLLGDSVLSAVLLVAQFVAVLASPEMEYLVVQGAVRYVYVLTPCLCIVGSGVFSSALLHANQDQSIVVVATLLIALHLGPLGAMLPWLTFVWCLSPSSCLQVFFPYHLVWFERRPQKDTTRKARIVELLQTTPPLRYNKEVDGRDREDHVCIVCMEDMEDGAEVRILSCRHAYHKTMPGQLAREKGVLSAVYSCAHSSQDKLITLSS